MSGREELQPCPFCGGKAEIWRAPPGSTRKAWIACMDRCAVITKEYDTNEEAIAAWNRRALSAPAVTREGDWQDIASAPKDGVPFWAYQPGREQFVCWEQDTRDGVVWMDEIDSDPKPTHWRPRPAPPSIPETKGEA